MSLLAIIILAVILGSLFIDDSFDMEQENQTLKKKIELLEME